MSLRLAAPKPPKLNGRIFMTCTSYRLDIEIVDGKRRAKGKIAYVMPEQGPEFDVEELIRQPFVLELRAGAVNYAMQECEAGEPFICHDTIVDGEWVAGNVEAGDLVMGFRFSSNNVHVG